MNNKKIGNGFETEMAQLLFRKGFWCHVMASKTAGQPADIIASKDGHPFLIDAKVCSDDCFDLSRIEENQKNAMLLWDKTGNGQGYFALKMQSDGTIFMLDCFTALLHRQTRSTLPRVEVEQSAHTFDEWLKRVLT